MEEEKGRKGLEKLIQEIEVIAWEVWIVRKEGVV